MQKTCTQCKLTKPLDAFSPHRGGYQSACKDCRSAASREKYAATKSTRATAADNAIRAEDLARVIQALRELPTDDSAGYEAIEASRVRDLIAGIRPPSGDVLTIECDDCARHKPFDDFPRDAERPSGRSAFCRDCTSERRTAAAALRAQLADADAAADAAERAYWQERNTAEAAAAVQLEAF